MIFTEAEYKEMENCNLAFAVAADITEGMLSKHTAYMSPYEYGSYVRVTVKDLMCDMMENYDEIYDAIDGIKFYENPRLKYPRIFG